MYNVAAMKHIEVRIHRTGYLVPAHGDPGALPDGQSCWDVAAAVSWFHRGAIVPRTPHPA